MDICYIIGAGDVFPVDFEADETDYIICADGGYAHRALLGREPDSVLGDFDSLGYVPGIDNKQVFSCEKDESDMLLCVEEGLKKGYRRFVIIGGLGGERMDHSVANLQLLHNIALKGAVGFLLHRNIIFTCIHNSKIEFNSECKGYISVFSLTDESVGVTIKNLKYETDSITFKNYMVTGLSNEFLGIPSSISVEKGSLLVSWNGTVSECSL